MRIPLLLLLTLIHITPSLAGTPQDVLDTLAQEASKADPGFPGFSAPRGEAFFRSRHGGDWSCASCHTDHPAGSGRHIVTGKPIEPLAPAANPDRFTRLEKTEKWFRRNCKDVLSRVCTAREKGDVLTYLLSIPR